MKNLLILLGLMGSSTVAFSQTKSSPIVQEGKNNVVKMEIKGNSTDTLGGSTRIITQTGENQIHIESTTSPDSLRTTLENVAIEQQGKGNVVSIKSTAGKGNTVSVSQSGSGNTVSIKQN